MKKQKEICVCDYCKEEITAPYYVATTDVTNGGCSAILRGCRGFDVDNADYCDLECLFAAIRAALSVDIEEDE